MGWGLHPTLVCFHVRSNVRRARIRWSIDRQKVEIERIFNGIELERVWFQYSHKQLLELGLGKLLKYHGSSFFKLLSAVYPEKPWNILQQRRLPKNFWEEKENRRYFLESLFKECNFKTLEDFKSLSTKAAIKLGASRLLALYGGSFYIALQDIYSNYDWSRRVQARNHWEDIQNQREFLDQLYKKWNFSSMNDWYSVTNEEVRKENGGTLVRIYGSVFKMVSTLYPELEWNIMLSQSSKADFWKENENIKNFILHIINLFDIRFQHDWYRVSVKQLKKTGGSSLIHSKGMYELLKMKFPDLYWNKFLLNLKNKKSEQRYLFVLCRKLFPSFHVIEEYNHPKFQFQASSSLMEIDVFIVEINIGLEYQGQQHFDEIHTGFFAPIEAYKGRDFEKITACRNEKVLLIPIPYWWDQSLTSLHQSLTQQFLTYLNTCT